MQENQEGAELQQQRLQQIQWTIFLHPYQEPLNEEHLALLKGRLFERLGIELKIIIALPDDYRMRPPRRGREWMLSDAVELPPRFFAVQLLIREEGISPTSIKISYYNNDRSRRLETWWDWRISLGRNAGEGGVSYVFFRPDDLGLMDSFLEEMNQFADHAPPPRRPTVVEKLVLDECDRVPFEIWAELCGILERRYGQTIKHLRACATNPNHGDFEPDRKLALLLDCFPNIQHLDISTPGYFVLPVTFQSFAQLQFLSELHLSRVILTEECLFNLADSIENLPGLTTFILRDWMVHRDPEVGFEALFCCLGKHPNVIIEPGHIIMGPCVTRQGCQYSGDLTPHAILQNVTRYYIDESHYTTLQNGPTCFQVLTQMKRQNRLPAGFPQNNFYNGNLPAWVESLIAVKDDQLKGEDRWDVFHFLFSQLGYDAFNNPDYWDATDPNVRVPWIHTKHIAAAVCIQQEFRRYQAAIQFRQYQNKCTAGAVRIQCHIRRFIVQRRQLRLHQDIEFIRLGHQEEEQQNDAELISSAKHSSTGTRGRVLLQQVSKLFCCCKGSRNEATISD